MSNFTLLRDLGTFLGNIVGKAVSGTLEERFHGPISSAQVFTRDQAGKLVPLPVNGQFVPNNSYLQVMINQMYVRENRQLWVTREHLGAVWMSFRYDGALRTIPFMLGRDLLIDKVQQLPQDAHIEFQNVRVGTVYPYTGDSLALYLGLWSAPVIDWATTIFGALDTIASKVKVAASLSAVLDMVDVLNQGISQVLGLNQIQAHLNLYQEFQDPTVGDIGLLEPGYYVMINAPNAGFDPSILRVVDGQLHAIGEDGQPHPYYERDFLLYSISSLPHQSVAVDMFRKQYQEVLKALIGSKTNPSKEAEARQAYHTLQTQIVTSPDLTLSDQGDLIDYFGKLLDREVIRLAAKVDRSSFGPGVEPAFPPEIPQPSSTAFESFLATRSADVQSVTPAERADAAAAQFTANLQDVAAA